jgi:hypothetical protein
MTLSNEDNDDIQRVHPFLGRREEGHELTPRPKESIQLQTLHILSPSVSLIREKT